MKKQQFKRILLILLSTVILLTSVVACAKKPENADSEVASSDVEDTLTESTTDTEKADDTDKITDTEVTESEDVTEETETEETETEDLGYTYDEDGYIMDNLSDELDFKSQNINMLHWQTSNEYVTESGKNAINSALYYRVLNVQDRLNCFISIQYQPGGWDKRTEFITKVYNDVMSGQPTIDIVSHYSFAAPIGTMYGLYQNLNAVENIELDMPWWISDITESIEIDGKVYFATGDIAPNSTKMTYCMFFNADLLDGYGYTADELYAYAIDGDWTIEKMNGIVKGAYADNGDNVPNEFDTYGIAITDTPTFDALFYGAGMRIIDKNSDGTYSLSRDWAGVKTDNLVETYKDLVYSQDCAPIDNTVKAFTEGRAILLAGNFSMALQAFSEVPFKYGVLPIPKYDEAQTDYGTCIAPTHSLYSVTYNTPKSAMAGAVLEALASDAYRNVTPLIFEEGLKVQYSQDVKDAQIYDIIRESVMFDIGRIWGDQLAVDWRNAFGTFRNAIEHRTAWMTLVSATQATYIESLNTITNTITSLDH